MPRGQSEPTRRRYAQATRFIFAHFARLNEIMAQYLQHPYPARSAVGVSQLPRGALVEIEAILVKG
jgi:enamine deaminase RidA (YjgF/YER057c/UK114 family)